MPDARSDDDTFSKNKNCRNSCSSSDQGYKASALNSEKNESEDSDSILTEKTPVVTKPVKAASKGGRQSLKKSEVRKLKVPSREICDQFMKLNTQTLQWQQQSSQPVKNYPEEKSFLENTFVNHKFKVYLVEAQWINQVRKYIAQVCQVYNLHVPQANDEIPKKSKAKSGSKARKVVVEAPVGDGT